MDIECEYQYQSKINKSRIGKSCFRTALIVVCMSFCRTMKVKADQIRAVKKIADQNSMLVLIVLACFFALLSIAILLYTRETMLAKQKKVLAEANKKLEQAVNAKTEFLSRMSHEIRTPMNAILGMTQLAKEEIRDLEAVEGYLNQIESSGNYLLRLINDILDVSRIDNGKFELHPEWCPISSVMIPCEKMMEPLMKQKNITFRHFTLSKEQAQVEWYVDFMRVNQLFLNLLNNAYKFTPEGGTVDVLLRSIEKKDGVAKVTVIVHDTGCGMSEDFLKHIGEPFVQEQNQYSKDVVGTGLGLVLVKNVIQAMGGSMKVTSSQGKGTTFELLLVYQYRVPEKNQTTETAELPLAIHLQKQLIAAKKKTMHDSLKGKNVLLVDDNEINAMIAKKFLENVGMQVDTAENGQSAVEKYQKSEINYYDIILMDVRMPVMDGMEATKMIRTSLREDAENIPIIAMTADAFATDRDKTKEAGMSGHLNKPILSEDLYKMLKQYV